MMPGPSRWRSPGSSDAAGDDFEVGVQVASDPDGAEFLLERAGSLVTIQLSGAGATQYGVVLTRVGANGTVHFLHAGTALQGDASLSDQD